MPKKSKRFCSSSRQKRRSYNWRKKRQIIKADTAKEAVDELIKNLKKDGYDFSVGIDINTPIADAERVVSVGKGIGSEENMELARQTAKAFGVD